VAIHPIARDKYQTLRFSTPIVADTLRAYELLQTYVFPGRKNLGCLFAFEARHWKIPSG